MIMNSPQRLRSSVVPILKATPIFSPIGLHQRCHNFNTSVKSCLYKRPSTSDMRSFHNIRPGLNIRSMWKVQNKLSAVGYCLARHDRLSSTQIAKEFSLANPLMEKYLQSLLEEYEQASKALMLGNQGSYHVVNKLTGVATAFKTYLEKRQEFEELQRIITDPGLDVEMKQLAKEDLQDCEAAMNILEREALSLLIPYEPGDDSDIILELKAGVGGQEAMLFTSEIFSMYQGYALSKGWKFDIVDYADSDIGGARAASAIVSGDAVYSTFKFEAGVHRVQRVPKTEKSGRIHTSTITVAVLPQPTEIEVVLNPKDIKFDSFKASGKGGQHVNTTDSAIRLTHIPTGTVVECQSTRSQIKNKETGMTILRSRIFDMQIKEQQQKQTSTRRGQVGSGGYSEKIRTYNYSQSRITDHRLSSANIHNMDEFLAGGEAFNQLLMDLQHQSKQWTILDKLEQFRTDKKS